MPRTGSEVGMSIWGLVRALASREGGGREGGGPDPEGGGVRWEKADLITFYEARSGCHVEPWRSEAGVLSTHQRGAVGRPSADRGAKVLPCAGPGLGFPGNRPRMWLLRRRPLSSPGTGSSVSGTSGTGDSEGSGPGPLDGSSL